MDSLKSPGPSLEERLDQLVLKVTLSVLRVHVSVQHTSICWELVLFNFHLTGHPGILEPKICKTKISPVLFSPPRLQLLQNWSRCLGFCFSSPTDRLFFLQGSHSSIKKFILKWSQNQTTIKVWLAVLQSSSLIVLSNSQATHVGSLDLSTSVSNSVAVPSSYTLQALQLLGELVYMNSRLQPAISSKPLPFYPAQFLYPK